MDIPSTITHHGHEPPARNLDGADGRARDPHRGYRDLERPPAGHGLFRFQLADRHRRLFCPDRRIGSGDRCAFGPASARGSDPHGFPAQGCRAGHHPRLRFLQVWLVIPAVQLLLDPDRRSAGGLWRAGAQCANPQRREACRENEQAGRQALQFRPACHILLDWLSWLVRRPGGLHAVKRPACGRSAAPAILLECARGGSGGNGRNR